MSLDDFKNLYRHEFKRETTDKRGGVPGVDYSRIGLPPTVSHTRTSMPRRPERKSFARGADGDHQYEQADRRWIEEVYPNARFAPDPGMEPYDPRTPDAPDAPAKQVSDESAREYKERLSEYNRKADEYDAALFGTSRDAIRAQELKAQRERDEHERAAASFALLQQKVASGRASVSERLVFHRATGYTPTGHPLTTPPEAKMTAVEIYQAMREGDSDYR